MQTVMIADLDGTALMSRKKGDFHGQRASLRFGTGNATVTNLYNTCFALRDGDEYFMVDAGGETGS